MLYLCSGNFSKQQLNLIIMVSKVLFSSRSDEWSTPDSIFHQLDSEFHFTLDPCSTDENCKCKKHFTKIDNGLILPWCGSVFVNPPYSQIRSWVEKCFNERIRCSIIVLLIPARTDTSWFHDFIYMQSEIRFIRGRLKFGDSKNSAPFPSMVVIFR